MTRGLCSYFDELLERLVLDVMAGPFRYLVSREVPGEFHNEKYNEALRKTND